VPLPPRGRRWLWAAKADPADEPSRAPSSRWRGTGKITLPLESRGQARVVLGTPSSPSRIAARASALGSSEPPLSRVDMGLPLRPKAQQMVAVQQRQPEVRLEWPRPHPRCPGCRPRSPACHKGTRERPPDHLAVKLGPLDPAEPTGFTVTPIHQALEYVSLLQASPSRRPRRRSQRHLRASTRVLL
jgi:hypothetical protein